MAVSEEEIFRTAGTEKVAWEDDVENAKIIGNLPFGIATELLLKWIRDIPERKGPFAFGRVPMVLLFQKEVAMVRLPQYLYVTKRTNSRGRSYSANLCTRRDKII
jgi:16S rRNA A1518/A1519 N6-dimethyltransferase RsmA/KsgA/DIM1 with predicted DNA glycosylase/AP lyase activity